MARENFNELLLFLAVAEEKSFTKAAAKLGIAQSTLSYGVKELEAWMGLRLLTRTTRSVATTEAGARLHQSLAPRISEIEADIEALMAYRDKPAGTVRITLSSHAMESVVWPKLAPIIGDYPDITRPLDDAYRRSGRRDILTSGRRFVSVQELKKQYFLNDDIGEKPKGRCSPTGQFHVDV